MADLDQLKQKYAPVTETIQRFAEYGATLDAVDLDGEKLHIKATVPSKVVVNRVWDAIKQCDPAYADLHHEIATTGGDEQPYTIKAGDNLSKVSKLFYGNANKYPEIAKANGLDDPTRSRSDSRSTCPSLPNLHSHTRQPQRKGDSLPPLRLFERSG